MVDDSQTFSTDRSKKSKGRKDAKVKTKKNEIGRAIGITLLLSVFLWWLPVFGQMISGFVGGRRAGSVTKGFAAVFAAMVLFVAALYGLSQLGFSVTDAQDTVLGAVTGSFPAFGEFATSVFGYMQGFFERFLTVGSELAVIGSVTVLFGLVGGLTKRGKDTERIVPTPENSARPARSIEAMNSGRTGFGSFDDYVPMNGTPANRLDPSVSGSASAKKTVPESQVMIQEQERESPFASVLQMSDRKPAATAVAATAAKTEKTASKEDMEYI